MESGTTFGISSWTIANLQLFAGINDPRLANRLANCPVVQVKAQQAVSGGHLFIVLSGALAAGSEGHAKLLEGNVSKILPGESVGELAVLDNAADTLSVVALEDSELLQIDAEKLWQIIDESHGVARNLLHLLAFRIRAGNAQLRRKQKVGEFYRQMSMNDSLTGLYNRAWLDAELPNIVTASHAQNEPLSVIMVDLDHFKRFNDEHGHQTGDHALRIAAKVLASALRPSDFACRYGGEELIIILPKTAQTLAVMVAQRLCARMQEAKVFTEQPAPPLPHLTASFGVACLQEGQSETEVIAQADAALYRAKQAGRNCVAL